jgi:HSP20 family molecular chaperone IbpA
MAYLFDWRKSLPLHHRNGHPVNIEQQLNRILEDFYNPGALLSNEDWESFNLSPSVDIVEDKDNYKIEAEMPGMGLEDINVSISDGLLTISGGASLRKWHNASNRNDLPSLSRP